ncbi:MAG: type II toxin-antitoxin system RelE/ParE family toxin [Bacteroidales bacterium]|nr:type II toxin-antitoxin system RelE/ParE family toxin [Bacteroidales bacterium]
MKYEVEFRKEAHLDILEAITWYEKRKKGLGDELFIALENVKHLIEQNPYHFEDKYKGIRKAITKRFPYIIYYRIESENKVLVFAVLHMKRSPKLWKGRIK